MSPKRSSSSDDSFELVEKPAGSPSTFETQGGGVRTTMVCSAASLILFIP